MITLKHYPRTPTDITLDRVGTTTGLQLMAQGSSGARVQMQGVHYTQATAIFKPEKRHLFAGPERDYANYMFNAVAEFDCNIVKVVNRFAKTGGSKDEPLETLVFVERVQDSNARKAKPIIDLIRIPRFIQNHPTFAIELTLTKLGKRLHPGKFLRKGQILAQTSSVIDNEYCIGLHANTILVAHPMVIEDSCLISESLAERMGTYGYKTYRLSIGEKDYPLFMYEDRHGNPSLFPDVGDKVRDDGILFAKREHDTLLAGIEMSIEALKEPCAHYDECTHVNPKSVVMDIKVHRDDLRKRVYDPATGERLPCDKMSTPVGMQEICDEYADGLSRFQKQIRDMYQETNRNYGRKGFKSVMYNPDAKQAIMYAIADDPQSVNRNLSRYVKQFGNIKCDDYIVEITVRFPIPLSVSGKITDTMGGKGIVGMILPDDQMPIDGNGNRVDLMMSENAMLRRTNFNRGFEHYINAARRDVELDIIDLYNDGKTQEAFEKLVHFCNAVNHEWAEAILHTHQTNEEIEDMLEEIASGKESLRVWVPSDNEYTMEQTINNVKTDFPPARTPLTVTMPNGEKRETVKSIIVGQLYMIRLDKWGGEFSAIGAGRFQAFGTIAKQHSSDKHLRPCRENPINHGGESEHRHQSAYGGGDICADAHDRNNNPVVADNVTSSILTAEVPTNIDHAVDRVKYPLGHNRVMEINRHNMRCDGIAFTTRRLN